MNFQVPQFISEKAHIIGPLTFAQLGYLMGAGFIAFLFFSFFTPFVAGSFSAVFVGVALALALGKFNGVSIASILVGAVGYLWKPRVYTWQRTFATQTFDASSVDKIEAMRRKMGVEEKLKAIALSVTTGKIFAPKAPEVAADAQRFQMVSYLTGEKKLAKRIDYR
ncbi:MAG: hypothetical protein Q7S84_04245 [bacterium]|nr:hypothetical protein [bacterium]